jgi:hypothetical protein
MNYDHGSPHLGAYLRFLHLVSAVKMLPDMDSFDANTEALFEEIMLAWSSGTPLSVRQAICIDRLGSPATLHKRVGTLRKMELIEAAVLEGDRRTKFLVPTSKGHKYIAKLDEAYLLCLKPNL